ncbi:hypothetical protein L1987_32128 [Smallanthus sonchifolius]|uniref:Uncharacterized protein n=1 Tax=Smallanthus sonchifolius TaxID=185202 RepID=A0ACB9I7B8_9ASTR|nr:hypothetical protein L1987_32128 [Smallanthus sonchifolius]
MSILTGKLLLWFPLVYIYSITLAQPDFVFNRCENAENYTINSTYKTNLDATLSALPTANSGLGFFNFSAGEGNNTVNSIALCRGDVEPQLCSNCVNDAIVKLRKLCPNQKEAFGIYVECLLKYSNNTLLVYPQKDRFIQFNPEITTDINGFNGALRPLMDELRGRAAAGGPLLKFATGNKTGPGFIRIYGLVQCSPYLTEQQCSDCLEEEVTRIGVHDNGKVGGKIVLPTCNFRFETYSFFNQTSPATPPPPAGKKKSTTRTVIIVIVVVTIIAVITIASLGVFMRLRKKNKRTPLPLVQMIECNGYMAPEYAMHGQFSVKSDVFSFGVLVLEMVTGQKNQFFRNGENIEDLLGFAWESWKNGTGLDMIDPTLKTRPDSMRNIIKSIHIGPEKPLLQEYSSSTGSSFGKPNISKARPRSAQMSINDVSTSEIIPR